MSIEGFTMGEGEKIDFQQAAQEGLPTEPMPSDGGEMSIHSTPSDVPSMEIDPPTFKPQQVQQVEANDRVSQLESKIEEMVSERGRYGREVVGPLRQENDALRERLAALEGRLDGMAQNPQPSQPAPTPEPTVEEIATALFGPDVDTSDPEVLRDARAQMTALRVSDQNVDAKLAPVLQRLDALTQQLSAEKTYENAGLSGEQVRQIIKENPELADLPAEKVASFAGRLLGKSGPGGAPQARPTGTPPVPDYGDPALAVDGGPEVFGNPAERPTDADGMAALTKYRSIGFGAGKPSIAEAQKAELLRRLQGGSAFSS